MRAGSASDGMNFFSVVPGGRGHPQGEATCFWEFAVSAATKQDATCTGHRWR
mgnify:CR=1 FL=1